MEWIVFNKKLWSCWKSLKNWKTTSCMTMKRVRGGENMKKILAKKMKKSSKAIHYFSDENLTRSITTVDTTCSLVVSISSCGC